MRKNHAVALHENKKSELSQVLMAFRLIILNRHLAKLCGIHVGQVFSRLCIDTTWGELSSEYGASCLLNVG